MLMLVSMLINGAVAVAVAVVVLVAVAVVVYKC